MRNEFVECMHCQTINFESEQYCSNCDFRLPHSEVKFKEIYYVWNLGLLSIILVLLFLVTISIRLLAR